jgi:hypothetical protein
MCIIFPKIKIDPKSSLSLRTLTLLSWALKKKIISCEWKDSELIQFRPSWHPCCCAECLYTSKDPHRALSSNFYFTESKSQLQLLYLNFICIVSKASFLNLTSKFTFCDCLLLLNPWMQSLSVDEFITSNPSVLSSSSHFNIYK